MRYTSAFAAGGLIGNAPPPVARVPEGHMVVSVWMWFPEAEVSIVTVLRTTEASDPGAATASGAVTARTDRDATTTATATASSTTRFTPRRSHPHRRVDKA